MPDVQLPNFHEETFFSKDTLFQTEVPARGSHGVAGESIPESIQSDNVIMTLLLCCFVLVVVAFSRTKTFLVRQAKRFFYPHHEGMTENTETSGEISLQIFLVFLNSLLLSVLYYFYTLRTSDSIYILPSPYLLIVFFLAIILLYFTIKIALYSITNHVLFDSKKSRQWMQSLMFLITLETVLFFPIILILANLGLSVENVEFYFAIVLIIVKLLTIYKCYIIFFHQNVFRLQIILYFCALEMIPLISLWGVLEMTVGNLKINF